jgi:integrase
MTIYARSDVGEVNVNWQGHEHRGTKYQGDNELVFHHPERGSVYRAEKFREALKAAFKAPGLEYPAGFRPFHDLRQTAITNDAAAGSSPIAVMTRAGHSNMTVTKKYMHLAGVVFRTEAENLERRMLGEAASASDV